MERKHIVALVGLAAVLVAATVGVGVWLGDERLDAAMRGSTGDIASAAKEAAGEPDKPQPTQPPGPYEPSSEYIEPGLDPDVTTFAMDKGDAPTDPNLPEMLSGAAIQRVTNQHQNELVQCYADALKDDPDLAGRVFFDFGVAPDGHVAMVRVTGSKLRSKPTEDCFVDKARRWKFPATRRQVLTRFDTDFNFVTQ